MLDSVYNRFYFARDHRKKNKDGRFWVIRGFWLIRGERDRMKSIDRTFAHDAVRSEKCFDAFTIVFLIKNATKTCEYCNS